MLKVPVAAAVTVGILAAAVPAYADGTGPEDCGGLEVCVGAYDPASPEHHSPKQHHAAPSKGKGKKPVCKTWGQGQNTDMNGDGPTDAEAPDRVEVPCQDSELGSFSGGCYYKPAPAPPADDPVWKGHKPGDGAIYQKTCPMGSNSDPFGTNGAGLVWMAKPPGGAGADPAELARQAVDKMTLRGADIGIVPKPGGKGVVGMPVYMWTRKSAETYGPNTATASAGPVTVSATAKVSRIEWTMGDGHTVTCTTAGTPYRAQYGKNDSPDCGYRYDKPSTSKPGGKYHVTARSTWTVDWTGGGQSGQLTEVRNSAVDINVAEVQVLN
ncbi:ATP/GTP-binding protein [Streptomyces sp. CA2R101]|uniref:ATP/GTP-binding protein n=1 Tax=Streptomyces sp. CA2R101 TaxID=3120152 RepID=UPI003008190A